MRLASVHSYPVKGCRRIDHDGAVVEPWGVAGDRRWLIVDTDGKSVTQREDPGLVQIHPSMVDGAVRLSASGMPDLDLPQPTADPIEVAVHHHSVLATPAGPAADDWLSDLLDRKVRLVWLDDPTRRPVLPPGAEPGDRVGFADAYPLLLTNTASLAALNGWILAAGSSEAPLPMTRFRPNVVVSGAEAWAEDGWLGRRLRIGTMTFRVVKPCSRCVVTTTDQDTGQRGREPLRTLAKHRNVNQKLLFGTNLIPDGVGYITVGDPIEVL